MKIAFIGGGNMGEAMLAAVLDRQLFQPPDVAVSDISQIRRRHIKEKYGVAVVNDNIRAVNRRETVVLAVKPQSLAEVMAGLKDRLLPEQMVLSIIAGARVDTIRHGLNHPCLVRAIPNTPAQINRGMTVWTATAEVNSKQKEQAGIILGAMGSQIYVDDEKYIDMATAVSGSGPAYVFLFMEALVEAAVGIGLPPDMAKELVLTTVLGSAKFARQSDENLTELRQRVTSPGGTTAEALARLETEEFARLVEHAVKAAYNKAKSLGAEQ